MIKCDDKFYLYPNENALYVDNGKIYIYIFFN